ncbi:uncharacterized protein LOC117191514 [Drosophila miranda]|uniref:uncharacterized protein LOC117191514 n=1 Tax=Drosophila miranda TaxID=7229 RepID=UPI00143FB09A|nr:uncharacterized protein LOC117191514 [Drosophila miranda]
MPTSSNLDYPEYHLTGEQKSYILSKYLSGAAASPNCWAGYFSSRFGCCFFVISLATGLFSVVTSVLYCRGGWKLLFGVRLLQALVMGGMWPCLYMHLAKWCPKKKQNHFGGVMTTGLDCGTDLSGVLSASHLGWPSSFYVQISEITSALASHIDRPFLVLAFCKMSQACSFYT